jgi:hypothetical protein
MGRAMSDAYLNPYRDAEDACGASFGITLWASPQAQKLRFEVMSQMCFFAGKRMLDAGCSRGDLAEFLHERDIAYAHYAGIDGLPHVIQFAQSRGLPRTQFLVGDFVQQPQLLRTGDPQIITISGSLNTMRDPEITGVLEAAWASTGETLIFNFLSDRVVRRPRKEALHPARRLNTVKMLDWALTRTPNVALRHDYFSDGHDCTILLRKG